ncbi:hypothetical protein JYU34_011011 [Plutella xylostella]|uniref:Glucose-methanol-choline oxidoreductase N-terminal domain-containing protein n=1 Tax=Plutella xylostella TaxID=51655 RepID=A0ABQ7QFV6_PLUXY|nr:hypothetical protein JYU34_011011 [Plutella xylostella]
MRWTVVVLCVLAARGGGAARGGVRAPSMFDAWTELFRARPRDPREGFVPDHRPHHKEQFDFIVVGAGSAGSVLANRLSEVPDWKVLLLEAGGNENFFSDIPIFAPFLSLTSMNWGYNSDPQEKACKDLRGNVCFMPRGKVLGGSSVLNFLIYQRGHPDDYNDWARMGNDGWNYSEVLPYFKKSENMMIPELRNSSYHGVGGYLEIDYSPYRSPLERLFREAGEELGHAWRDPNGEHVLGFSKPQATMRRGRRCSTSKAFLEPVRFRENLKVSKHSTVLRILIDPTSKAAYGVEFMKDKKRYEVIARREVVLSAGTIGSAQLLLVSGVGPAGELRARGVPPLQDLPVGHNLQDHVTFSGNAFIVNDSSLCVNDATAASPAAAAAYLAGRGPLTLPGGAAGLAFLRTSLAADDPAPGRPDMELVMGAGSLAGDMLGILRSLLGVTDSWFWQVYGSLPPRVRLSTFAMNPVLIRPRSVGRLTLRSARVQDPPHIQPNYFHDPRDLQALREGVRMVQRVIATRGFQRYGARLHATPFPGCERLRFDSDQYWDCAIMQTSITLDHQVGTCKMGPAGDPTAVVSPRLAVHGLRGLRVADASIMPRIPAAHTHAPVVMIAEKAADMIKQDWGR